MSRYPHNGNYAFELWVIRRWRHILGVVVVGAALAIGAHLVLGRHAPLTGAERIRSLASWPEGCAGVTIERPLRGDGSQWQHTVESALIACQTMGPALLYARFASEGERDRQLARFPPPSGAYCTAGTEVVLDALDDGFPRLCKEIRGRLYPPPRSFVERLPPDRGPYRFAHRPVVWVADQHLRVMVRLNRALPISHRFLAADMRVDGRRAIDPMTTVRSGTHCYEEVIEPLEERLPSTGGSLSVELVVDGEPRGVVTRRTRLGRHLRPAEALHRLGC